MNKQLEAIVKATSVAICSSATSGRLTVACRENPLLEILLRDLIADAARLNRRLAEIQGDIQ